MINSRYMIIFYIVLFSPVIVFPWTTPINISDSPLTFSRYPSISIDKMNHVHVVWDEEIQYSSNEEIFYRYYDGNSWGSIVNVSRDSLYSGCPSVIVDTLCQPNVVWCTWCFRGMWWTQWVDGSWTDPLRIYSDIPGEASWVKMSLDQFNRIHLVWTTYPDGPRKIWYSFYDGINWSVSENLGIEDFECAVPDIAIDSENNLHVVWSAAPYDSLEPSDDWQVYYSKYDGISWSNPVVISSSYVMSLYPRISIDIEDCPHVVWEVSYGGHHIYYTYFDGLSWFIPYKISEDASEPVIALDSQDNVHVLWTEIEDSESDIYYSFYDGTQWSDPFNVSNSSKDLLVELAIDSGGCLHAVWLHRHDLKGDVYYSKHVITGVDSSNEGENLLNNYSLGQNFPNPFNQATIIPYKLGDRTTVTLLISDITGRVVKSFQLGCQSKGNHTFSFEIDSLSDSKNITLNGIYFYKIKAGKFSASMKMIFISNRN